ncbi:MAG: hypothetical protein ACRELF_12035 [Gemmataceae bacterium]
MKRASGEFSRFDLPGCVVEVKEADGSIRVYLDFVLPCPIFPLDEDAAVTGWTERRFTAFSDIQ